jgi:hypothetical protein
MHGGLTVGPLTQFLGHNLRAMSAIFWTSDVADRQQSSRCDPRV